MALKDFLLLELCNVRDTLQESLRHDFAPGDGREYFEECKLRIDRLTAETEGVDKGDDVQIAEAAARLSEYVSQPICLIERSHLGEFSWPFAHEVRRIARPLCAEPNRHRSLRTPIIHILAEGGLSAYKIYAEDTQWETLRDRRIINIVFPRTLKNHVLIHAILGHEIGHAAYLVPSIRNRFESQVIKALASGTVLESIESAEKWFQSESVPPIVKTFRATVIAKRPHPFSFTGNQNPAYSNWLQEFYCDLFGLITFGPSFAFAHKTLLGAVDADGVMTSTSTWHPPYACRAAFVSRAIHRLRLRWARKAGIAESDQLKTSGPYYATSGDAAIDEALEASNTFLRNTSFPNPWFDIFPDEQIDSAIDKCESILRDFDHAVYSPATPQQLRKLVKRLSQRTPPCGAQLHAKTRDPAPTSVDFRNILEAGWIVELGKDKLGLKRDLTFLEINRLCDIGILHQQAIDVSKRFN